MRLAEAGREACMVVIRCLDRFASTRAFEIDYAE